jgi:hypothetical protein
MLMMSPFSLYFQQVFGMRFCPAAYRSARIVTTPTLQVDRNHRHHRNHLRAKNNQKPIQAVPKKQSGLVFLYYFNILFIIVSSSPTRDSMNAYGYSGDGGYGGVGQLHGTGSKLRSHRFCVWAGTSRASGAQAEPLYCKEIQGVSAHVVPCSR